jgi:hypothetical protein
MDRLRHHMSAQARATWVIFMVTAPGGPSAVWVRSRRWDEPVDAATVAELLALAGSSGQAPG